MIIGTSSASGGIGKNELSTKLTTASAQTAWGSRPATGSTRKSDVALCLRPLRRWSDQPPRDRPQRQGIPAAARRETAAKDAARDRDPSAGRQARAWGRSPSPWSASRSSRSSAPGPGGGCIRAKTPRHPWPPSRTDAIVRRTEVAFADAEAVWGRAAANGSGDRYDPARVVFYSRATETPCAVGAVVAGPFYCRDTGTAAFDLAFLDGARRAAAAAGGARAGARRGADRGRAPPARDRHARRRRPAADRRRARQARDGRRGAGAAGRLPDRRLGRRRREAPRTGARRLLEPARLVLAQRGRGPGEPGRRAAARISTSSPGRARRRASRPSARATPAGAITACPAPAEIVARG